MYSLSHFVCHISIASIVDVVLCNSETENREWLVWIHNCSTSRFSSPLLKKPLSFYLIIYFLDYCFLVVIVVIPFSQYLVSWQPWDWIKSKRFIQVSRVRVSNLQSQVVQIQKDMFPNELTSFYLIVFQVVPDVSRFLNLIERPFVDYKSVFLMWWTQMLRGK